MLSRQNSSMKVPSLTWTQPMSIVYLKHTHTHNIQLKDIVSTGFIGDPRERKQQATQDRTLDERERKSKSKASGQVKDKFWGANHHE